MRGRLALSGLAAVSVAAVLAVAWPQTQGLVVQVLVSCLAVLAAGVAGVALLASYPLVPRSRRSPAARAASDLLGTVRQRRQLQLGLEGAADYDRWLRPVLADVAGSLSRLHGLDLAEEPVRAQRLLGSDVWAMVTPVPPAGERGAPDRKELRIVFEKLEQL